jgi:hypothetical protein
MPFKLIVLLILVTGLAACEQAPPPPADVNVHITVEEKAPEKTPVTKPPRGTIIGNGQSYTRP